MCLFNSDTGAIERRLRKVPFSGIIFAALSAAFFSVGTFTVKLLPEINAIEIVVIRSAIQLTVYTLVILISGCPFKADGERLPLLGRSVLGFVSFTTGYASLHLIPLGDTSAIIFSAPVYVSIFACILLGEACGIFQFIIISITLSGAVFITKPTFIFGTEVDNTYRLLGCIFAFASSVTTALAFVFTRKLQRTPVSVVIAWFSALSIVLGLIFLTALHFTFDEFLRWPTSFTRKEWASLLGNGMCGVFGQLFLTLALKFEEAGLVSLTRCSDIVFAYIFQIVFLAEPVQWSSVLGAVIVMGGVAVSCIRKVVLERRASELRTIGVR
ncbi:Solute carrier family 35 member G1 [Halotydeus destructor]|nr:Solute carrier family 35 member G1 [Halotydeus destructor]